MHESPIGTHGLGRRDLWVVTNLSEAMEVLPAESGLSPEVGEVSLGDQGLKGMVLLQSQSGLIAITRTGEADDGGFGQRRSD
jgi:hypothetical protein